MLPVVLLGLIAISSYVGMALLALADPAHWHVATRRSLRNANGRKRLRCAGWALVVATLILSIIRDGAGFGILFGVLMLSLAAAAVVATLASRRNRLVK